MKKKPLSVKICNHLQNTFSSPRHYHGRLIDYEIASPRYNHSNINHNQTFSPKPKKLISSNTLPKHNSNSEKVIKLDNQNDFRIIHNIFKKHIQPNNQNQSISPNITKSTQNVSDRSLSESSHKMQNQLKTSLEIKTLVENEVSRIWKSKQAKQAKLNIELNSIKQSLKQIEMNYASTSQIKKIEQNMTMQKLTNKIMEKQIQDLKSLVTVLVVVLIVVVTILIIGGMYFMVFKGVIIYNYV